MPWSKTPLKSFFHRTVPVPGSNNTPNVSKISERKNRDNAIIASHASANMKMLVQLAEDPREDKSSIVIDTGMNGNALAGIPFRDNVFFDMNADHLANRLYPMNWNKEKLEGTRIRTLTISPKSSVTASTTSSTEGSDEEETEL